MAAFTEQQKLFVVEHLGAFHSLTQVQELLQKVFGLQASLQQIQRYDPTTAAGATLRPELKALFERARNAMIEGQQDVAIAHRQWRLRELQGIFEFYSRKAPLIALRALEQAAKEDGGAYVRPQEPDDDQGGSGLPEHMEQAVTTVYGDAAS